MKKFVYIALVSLFAFGSMDFTTPPKKSKKCKQEHKKAKKNGIGWKY